MKVYTYYEDIDSFAQKRVLELWKLVWHSHGWEPVVFGLEDAQKHPRFNELSELADKLPTVNGKRFERACYRRWAAYVPTGGIALDYDVFPIKSFPPRTFDGFISGELGGGPGLISGTPSNYERLISIMLSYTPRESDITFNRPHVSDMIIIKNHNSMFDSILDLCRTYRTPDWEKVGLVHFSNGYMDKHRDRSDQIREILGIN